MTAWREWDWPPRPRRHQRRTIDIEVTATLYRPAQRSIGSRIADAYFAVVVMIAKAVMGIVGAAVVVAAIWLLVTILG